MRSKRIDTKNNIGFNPLSGVLRNHFDSVDKHNRSVQISPRNEILYAGKSLQKPENTLYFNNIDVF